MVDRLDPRPSRGDHLLDAAIKVACQQPEGQARAAAVVDHSHIANEPRVREQLVVHEMQTSADAERLSWVTVYERAKVSRFATGYEIHEPGSAASLVHAIAAVVEVEAPIEVGLAISRVAEAHGIARRGSRVMRAGKRAAERAAGRGLIEMRESSSGSRGRPSRPYGRPCPGVRRRAEALRRSLQRKSPSRSPDFERRAGSRTTTR